MNYILYYFFLDESRDTKNSTNIISIVYFQQARLFTAKIFTDEYYPSGIFFGRAQLFKYSVSVEELFKQLSASVKELSPDSSPADALQTSC